MAYAFNGTTQNAAAGAKMLDASFTSSAEEIDISGSGDPEKTYETGLVDYEASITIIGSTTVAVGDTVALSIDWNDETADGTMTNAIVTSVETSGSLGSPITSKLTLKPTPAA